MSACIGLIVSLITLMAVLPYPAIAAAIGGVATEDAGLQARDSVVGVISTALDCLSMPDDSPLGNDWSDNNPSCGQTASTGDELSAGIVTLNWQGELERARLVLKLSGTQAAHPIYVNGKQAALTPVRPDSTSYEVFYLTIPSEILVPGDNLIEISDDGLPGDGWIAENVRIEAFGSPRETGFSPLPASIGDAGGDAAQGFVIRFYSSYDGSRQEAAVQIPDGYSGTTPVPLIVFAHPRGDVMSSGITTFGVAANARTWLLASPELHGSWDVPRSCRTYPNDCDYEDQVVAGTVNEDSDPKPGAFAYASLESQYDVVDTVKYMVENYNVKLDQIYLVGYSMGGQLGAVAAAKFPHLFAATLDNKSPTDMGTWYGQQADLYSQGEDHYAVRAMRKECHIGGQLKTPEENAFCYDRRSGIEFAGNYIHVPISMTHGVLDQLVPISHSRNLRGAINSHEPDWPAAVYESTDACSDPYDHCFVPDPTAVLNFLAPFVLNDNPTHISITSDESKVYYWMELVQTGGDHWSQVEVTRHTDTPTVVATIQDDWPSTLRLNLGASPLMGEAKEQPGMGLPATTYLITGAGNNNLVNYTSGYFSVPVATTGESTITVSAIKATLSANPAQVSVPHAPTTTISVLVGDHMGNGVPDGTSVELTTTDGTFAGGGATETVVTSDGRATTTLTLDGTSGNDQAEVVATVVGVTTSVSVQILHPEIQIMVSRNPPSIHSGESVAYQYEIENVGDEILTAVAIRDDNGTPGNSNDDVLVCSGMTLAPEDTETCSRSIKLESTATVIATVSGQDPLGNPVTHSNSATTIVVQPDIELQILPQPAAIYPGQTVPVTYRYKVTNTGDITLTQISVRDDDVGTVCSGFTLAPGASYDGCSRVASLSQTTTVVAVALAKDTLGWNVDDNAQVTVAVISPGIALQITATPAFITEPTPVTYQYRVTNTGDAALANVTVVDDNSTPAQGSDDILVCTGIDLAPAETAYCTHHRELSGTTTYTARGTGQDILGKAWLARDYVTVRLGIPVFLPIVARQ
jgi:dienelactone hydrolase